MQNFFLFILVIIPLIIIYGLITLTKKTDKQLPTHKPHTEYRILPVKNSEDTIEGTIRSAAWHNLTFFGEIPTLIVLDLDSCDNTLSILKRLSKEYTFLHPMSKSEYIRFISDM